MFFYRKVGAFLCQEKLTFSATHHFRPPPAAFYVKNNYSTDQKAAIGKSWIILQEHVVPTENIMYFPSLQTREKNVWSFFRQVLLSLPKLAVKNNSSKKNTQMWAKSTLMVDFVAQGSRKVDDTHQNPEIFDASGPNAFILSDLTLDLSISLMCQE